VYVTHDQEEALSLSDRLAVFMDGRVVQIGTPEEVFSRPATAAVAGFLGNPPMNLLPARLENGNALVEGAVVPLPRLQTLGSREVTIGVRPSGVRIAAEGLPATVTMCEALGEDFFIDVTLGEHLVRAKMNGAERPAERSQVRIALDPAALHVFDRETGARL
jgi:multiple sugar transport system ATP-binding protein